LIEITLYIFIFFLTLLQSLIGVGVLMIGTPLLLIFNFDIISTISILLPISISTSLINLIYFYFYKKKIHNLKIDKDIKKNFFLFCIPFIFVGTLILKYFNQYINFNYLVSAVIVFTVLLSGSSQFLDKIKNKSLGKFFLSTTGVVHGLTNSGGSLISIFISLSNNKNLSRYSITFFYFFLASFQFFIFILFFKDIFYTNNYYYVIFALPFAIYLANIVENKLKEIFFKRLIKALALISSIILVLT